MAHWPIVQTTTLWCLPECPDLFRSYLAHRSVRAVGQYILSTISDFSRCASRLASWPDLIPGFVNDFTDMVSNDKELFTDDNLIPFECDRQPTDKDHIVL